jgi:hypothetical protein
VIKLSSLDSCVMLTQIHANKMTFRQAGVLALHPCCGSWRRGRLFIPSDNILLTRKRQLRGCINFSGACSRHAKDNVKHDYC